MSQVVLVHGIGNERKNADYLEERWIPALARGVRLTRVPALADQLWRDGRPGALEPRVAFYGDLFRHLGRQGIDEEELSDEQRLLAERLAEEWLRRAADRASRPRDRQIADAELRHLRHQLGQEEGLRAHIRNAVASAARIGWFARAGVNAAQLVNRSLAQVTRYLTEDTLRGQIQQRVCEHLGPETRVLIGHSLGSVVAFEVAHQLDYPLPLLVTTGSPLGLRTIIYDRLRPQPPTHPPLVRRWVNIADPDDVVAAEPDLTALFPSPAECRMEGGWTVDNGSKPHTATFYLDKVETGRPVSETLLEGRSRDLPEHGGPDPV